MRRTLRRFLDLLKLGSGSSEDEDSDLEPQRAGRQHGASATASAPRMTNAIGDASRKFSENHTIEQPHASSHNVVGRAPPRLVSNEPRISDDEQRDPQRSHHKNVPPSNESSSGAKRTIDDLDLTNTTDMTQDTVHAPAVTHETVRPHVHEIIEEQVHRDIHTYDVYHRIQPIYDLEVLPARHFVQGPDGRVEVAATDLPLECTGPDARWRAGLMSPEAGSLAKAEKSPEEIPELPKGVETGSFEDGRHSTATCRKPAGEYYPDHDAMPSKLEELVLPIRSNGMSQAYSPASNYL
ncbi:hypothetical protein GGR57DRAFT_266688 [Xylariaceae sp. FL1272]|nr:hypothetical protein GGR57DRAFT_266688 [Xylariaceae sp. FL1272]